MAAGLTVAAPAYACACGGLVDQPGRDTSVTSETAVVVWDGETETIVLRLSTRTDAVSAGLLIPTPSPATAELGDEQVFTDLAAVTAPRRDSRWHLFGPPLLGGGDGGGDASAGGPGGGVQVLATVDLGPLRATTIAAANTPDLQAWLTSHDYDASPELLASVSPYVQESWTFVAIQLTAEGETLDGNLPPISMRFTSRKAVYPMRMSSVADESQQPLVHVLAEHRMLRTDPVASGLTRPDITFAGAVSPADVRAPDLQEWLATTPFLTTSSQWLPDPSEVISDFTYEAAAEDTAFQQVRYDEKYLLPGDLGALLVLLLVVGAVWLVVRLTRKRPNFPGGPGLSTEAVGPPTS
jgi:hypothetical protein